MLRFHWKWSDHEIKQAEHMQQTFAALLEGMGGKAKPLSGADAIQRPGEIIHEVGTARMGDKAAESVTNQYCQTWDVKNLSSWMAPSCPAIPTKPHPHHPCPRLAFQRMADGRDEAGEHLTDLRHV